MTNVRVTAHNMGATLHLEGETADLITDREIDESVERIKGKLEIAAKEAKRAIRAEVAAGYFRDGGGPH